MNNEHAERLIAVLERLADAIDGKAMADERRLRQKYDRSVDWLRTHGLDTTPRTIQPQPIDPDRITSFDPTDC